MSRSDLIRVAEQTLFAYRTKAMLKTPQHPGHTAPEFVEARRHEQRLAVLMALAVLVTVGVVVAVWVSQ